MDISEEAYRWVRENEKAVIARFIGDTPSVDNPVSFFMAGSPGSGKTEYSKSFIEDLNEAFRDRYKNDYPIVRIDADDIRLILSGYNGQNASLFQRASVLGVNILHDYVLKKKINFLLDGTFANEKYAIENIERSLKRDRKVQILYLFQNPLHAWRLTKAREMKEGRKVPVEIFIRDYFSAKEVVEKMKAKFADKISVDLAVRDFLSGEKNNYFNITDIDSYIKFPYNINTLKEELIKINKELGINY